MLVSAKCPQFVTIRTEQVALVDLGLDLFIGFAAATSDAESLVIGGKVVKFHDERVESLAAVSARRLAFDL